MSSSENKALSSFRKCTYFLAVLQDKWRKLNKFYADTVQERFAIDR